MVIARGYNHETFRMRHSIGQAMGSWVRRDPLKAWLYRYVPLESRLRLAPACAAVPSTTHGVRGCIRVARPSKRPRPRTLPGAKHSSLSEPIRPSKKIPRLAGGEVCLLEKQTMNHSSMELKVCEGCGVLWLRAGCPGPGISLHQNVYCKRCVCVLAEFPAPRGPKKASRTRVRIRSRQPLALAAAGGAR